MLEKCKLAIETIGDKDEFLNDFHKDLRLKIDDVLKNF